MDDRTQRKRPHIVITWLKIGVSASLLAWILWLLDIPRFLVMWRHIDYTMFFVALLSVGGAHLVNVARWKTCLLDQSERVTWSHLMVSYFSSMFVGIALHSYGSDVLRVKDLWGHVDSKERAVTSVLWTRLSGALASFSLFVLVGLFNMDRVISLGLLPLLLVSAGLVLFLSGLVLRRGGFLRWAHRLFSLDSILGRTASSLDSFLDLALRRRFFVRVMLLSLFLHFHMSINTVLFSRTVASPITIIDAMIFIPILVMANILPVSIGGLGLKEGVFVVYFRLIGLNSEMGLAVAIIARICNLVFILVGGLLFPFRNRLLDEPQFGGGH